MSDISFSFKSNTPYAILLSFFSSYFLLISQIILENDTDYLTQNHVFPSKAYLCLPIT